MMLGTTGKLLGLSGITDGAFSTATGKGWKIVFLSGFTMGGIVAGIVYPEGLDQTGAPSSSQLLLVVSGFLVGLGTRLGSGCTSGHGLCGLPRLSRRSILATLSFLTSGIAAASVMTAWTHSDPTGHSSILTETEPASLAVRSIAMASAAAGLLTTMAKKTERHNWRAHLASLCCGASFAGGLVLSGMVKRAKVLDFLTLRRESWDASLMFVLGCGVLTGLVGFPLVTRKLGSPACRLPPSTSTSSSGDAPTLAEKFEIPTATQIDAPLILGSWTFGVGWGLSGMCPGPAIVAGVFGLPGTALYFLPSMLLGMKCAEPLKTAVSLPDPGWVVGGSDGEVKKD